MSNVIKRGKYKYVTKEKELKNTIPNELQQRTLRFLLIIRENSLVSSNYLDVYNYLFDLVDKDIVNKSKRCKTNEYEVQP